MAISGKSALALPLGLLLAIVVLSAGSAHAQGKSTEYRRQESTRCTYGQGCPRMMRNAVNYATEFCRAEGGVRTGGTKSDFKCEQRGIYCQILGRITCVGRFDPNTAGLPPGRSHLSTVSTGRTCLNAACSKFVDHSPGNREQGVHACPTGHGMVGLSRPRSDVVCHALEDEETDSVLDTTTLRADMRACPPGMYLRGVSDHRTQLLCSSGPATVGAEVVQREPLTHGIQVCEEVDETPRFMTGLDVESAGLLCAPVK
jgi:hypothetical protein